MIDRSPPAVPAATLVVMREADGGPPEILMVERARTMAFAAGALVFPGGRVDAGDHGLAQPPGEDAAARIAAIRETVEEVGLGIAMVPAPDPAALAALRRALHGGEPFAPALATAGISLDLAALTPFARWRPAHRQTRTYDTRFYLARVPAGAGAPVPDATEVVRAFWASARDTLSMVEAGTASAIFPTRRNLERLARFATIDEAVADARAHPIETVTPWVETRDGAAWLCIPERIGYPVTAEPLATARRG